MATMKIAIPGIGGSLGECVVCGSTFVAELLLGRSVAGVNVQGIGHNLPVHQKCLDKMLEIKDGNWRDLPDGPLRTCFQETDKEMKSGDGAESVTTAATDSEHLNESLGTGCGGA